MRKFSRAAVSMPVSYVRDGANDPRTGEANDLGGGGMRLATAEDLPLGAVLLMRFRLPGSDHEIPLRGRIVLSFYNAVEKQYFHGIAFTQIDPRDQDHIVNYIAELMQASK